MLVSHVDQRVDSIQVGPRHLSVVDEPGSRLYAALAKAAVDNVEALSSGFFVPDGVGSSRQISWS